MRHSLPLIAVLVSTVAAAGCGEGGDPSQDVELTQSALCTPTKLATTLAVSSGTPKQAAKNAIDGNTGTRWESAYSDPQWIYVDLGAVKTVTEVRIDWQHAAAKDYHVDVSNDAVTWSAAIVTKTGLPPVDHRIDDLTGFSVSARYVRVYGTARATVYGYSIWELYSSTTARAARAPVVLAAETGARVAAGEGAPAGAPGRATPRGRARAARARARSSRSRRLWSSRPRRRSRPPRTPSTGTRGRDGRARTRIRSGIYFDLGAVKTITEVRIDWQHRRREGLLDVDVSNDAVTWSAPIASKTGLPPVDHRIDDLTGLSATGRYVRMYEARRARRSTAIRFWELQVSGFATATSCSTGATNLLTAGWDPSTVFYELHADGGLPRSAPRTPSRSTTPARPSSTPANTPTPVFEVDQSVTVPQAGSGSGAWMFTILGHEQPGELPASVLRVARHHRADELPGRRACS